MPDDPRVYELLLLRLSSGLSAALVSSDLTVEQLADRIADKLSGGIASVDEVARWTSRLRHLLCGTEGGTLGLRHLAIIEDVLGFDVWAITATS